MTIETTIPFVVVVNDEGQHAIWDAALAVPAGWTVRLPAAPKERCLAFIREQWTDIRPLSLQRQLAGAQ